MPRILVLHGYYGCETGCCGHYVEVDGERAGSFNFSHPRYKEDVREYVKRIVTEEMGEEHVKDIDFDNCMVFDD